MLLLSFNFESISSVKYNKTSKNTEKITKIKFSFSFGFLTIPFLQ